MKNIFKTLLASTLGMMALVSCDRTDDLAVIEYKDVPSLDASSFSSSSYVVTESNLASTFETIMFKKPVYTQNTAIESQIEIALAGTNFASPVNLGSTTENSYVRLLYRQLNEAVLALIDKDTYTAGTPVEIEVRVKSSIKTRTGSLLNPVYSSPVLIAVTPMSLEIQYTDLYLIGDATAAGWVNTATNANMYPLLKDATSNKAYTYTGYFAKGEFKMVETKGAWSPQYGFDSDGKLSTDGGSGNIPVAEAGYYKLTVDTAKLWRK
ncbi:MAG: SusF/SusE family outer membrane protein [Bergeyella zoohelcum]|nr:SusF/SusE family outer membrane protein [Bergeyella zoohelcum]